MERSRGRGGWWRGPGEGWRVKEDGGGEKIVRRDREGKEWGGARYAYTCTYCIHVYLYQRGAKELGYIVHVHCVKEDYTCTCTCTCT